MNPIVHLENDHVALNVFADASAGITDKTRNILWRMGSVALQEDAPMEIGHVWQRIERSICEQYPGRFTGVAEGDRVRYTLRGRLGKEVGQFTCRYVLDGPWLGVEVTDIDESLPNLLFPTPIVSESLVFPVGVGKWVRKPMEFHERRFWRYPSWLNMRWFGGLRGDDGWLAVIQDGIADAGVFATQMSATPVWLKSLGRWKGPRTVRYRFTRGGYVGMAKAFRQWTKDNSCFKSLEEKIAERPALRNLIGGRMLSLMQARSFFRSRFEDTLETELPAELRNAAEGVVTLISHKQAAAIIAEAKALGMKRGMFHLRGWIRGGYDETHPDIWPPEPALGSLDEFKALCAERDPYVTCLQDNYQDIYQQSTSFPHGVCRKQDGSLMPGGWWWGGQAYILNSKQSLEYAARNWPQLATLGMRMLYIDTVTTEQFKESYEQGNTQSRSEDFERKKALLAFFRDKGVMLGSENGADFGIPFIDWAPVGPHRRVPGESIPLWPLVFHDCIVSFKGAWSSADISSPAFRKACLLNMLWGYAFTFGGFTADTWPRVKDVFASTLHLDDWFGTIGTDEMTSHRYHGDDGQVEQTEFSSGRSIIANFADEPREAAGRTIPPGGHVLL
ncbi:hypothetical protein GX586_16410 [bacterium]|nr:hypothetical protein [bacterium]